MANRTRRCTVGTAIAYGVGRSPLTLAAEARDLDEISRTAASCSGSATARAG